MKTAQLSSKRFCRFYEVVFVTDPYWGILLKCHGNPFFYLHVSGRDVWRHLTSENCALRLDGEGEKMFSISNSGHSEQQTNIHKQNNLVKCRLVTCDHPLRLPLPPGPTSSHPHEREQWLKERGRNGRRSEKEKCVSIPQDWFLSVWFRKWECDSRGGTAEMPVCVSVCVRLDGLRCRTCEDHSSELHWRPGMMLRMTETPQTTVLWSVVSVVCLCECLGKYYKASPFVRWKTVTLSYPAWQGLMCCYVNVRIEVYEVRTVIIHVWRGLCV